MVWSSSVSESKGISRRIWVGDDERQSGDGKKKKNSD